MQIVPQSKREWLALVLLPFKAYTVIAPLVFYISFQFLRSRHSGSTDAEMLMIFALFPCSAILLLASLVLALVGPKGYALSCLGFGITAAIIGFHFLPYLATA